MFFFGDSGDAMEANDRFVTMHVRSAGVKTVRLPRKASVVDVFARRPVAQNVDAFTFDAPLHSSWLFYYGDDAEVLSGKLNGK